MGKTNQMKPVQGGVAGEGRRRCVLGVGRGTGPPTPSAGNGGRGWGGDEGIAGAGVTGG